MAEIGKVLLTPEAGWKRYDDVNGAFRYNGTWTTRGNATAYYGGAQRIQAPTVVGNTIEFDFIGDKIRLVTSLYPSYAKSVDIEIDGVTETFTLAMTAANIALAYEKTGLEFKRHTVKIERTVAGTYNPDFVFDAIDINDNGRLLHKDEVLTLGELEIGKRIRCHFQSKKGTPGVFSKLGEETYVNGIKDFVTLTQDVLIEGDFYFIMVDEIRGVKKLIADRGVQSNIPWDALNTLGLTTGVKVSLNEVVNPPYISKEYSTCYSASTSGWYGAGQPELHAWNLYGAPAPTVENPAYTIMKFEKPLIPRRFGFTQAEGRLLDFEIKGKNPDGAWDVLIAGSSTKNGRFEFPIKTDKSYNEIGVFATKTYSGSNIYIAEMTFVASEGILELEEQNAIKARVMTEGIDATDRDNEWDKYIVRSSLNGHITPGSNDEWNWILNSSTTGTWGSTTPTTSAAYRVARPTSGGSATYPVDKYADATTNTTYLYSIYRPVLEVESLFVYTYKHLVYHENAYKVFDSTIEAPAWVTVSATEPDVNTFIQIGMDSISEISESAWELLSGDFEIVTCTDRAKVVIDFDSIPKDKTIELNKEFTFSLLSEVKVEGLVEGNSLANVLLSGDSGRSWSEYNISQVNALTKTELQKIAPNGKLKIRLRLSINSVDEKAEFYKIKVNAEEYVISPNYQSLIVNLTNSVSKKPIPYVSLDDGATWRQVALDKLIDISTYPSTDKLKLKFVMSEGQEVYALAYSWV